MKKKKGSAPSKSKSISIWSCDWNAHMTLVVSLTWFLHTDNSLRHEWIINQITKPQGTKVKLISCGVDTTGSAASLPTLLVGLACHGKSSEHVEEYKMILITAGILFVGMISKYAPSSAFPTSNPFVLLNHSHIIQSSLNNLKILGAWWRSALTQRHSTQLGVNLCPRDGCGWLISFFFLSFFPLFWGGEITRSLLPKKEQGNGRKMGKGKLKVPRHKGTPSRVAALLY